MSAERSDFSPKFDIDGAYPRDEFIFRLEMLLATAPEGLARTIRENIAWAELHGPEAVVRWRYGADGYIYPYVETVVDGFPIQRPEG